VCLIIVGRPIVDAAAFRGGVTRGRVNPQQNYLSHSMIVASPGCETILVYIYAIKHYVVRRAFILVLLGALLPPGRRRGADNRCVEAGLV